MKMLKKIQRKIRRDVRKQLSLIKLKKLGIRYFPPNYIYFDNFNESSVIVDVGCGYEAELSRHMIEQHNLNAFGVDPTKKHAPSLKMLEESMKGKFHHLPIAVTEKDGFITFHESRKNESGSILLEHTNMQNDEITTYGVESVSLSALVKRVGTTFVDFLKLDLEGAEYALLDNISSEDIVPFQQIFIEFHHHCTNHSAQETKLLVQSICSKGFRVLTIDHHNYLFYK